MAQPQPQAPAAQPSKFAFFYGPFSNENRLRSGLTPLFSVFPSQLPPKEVYREQIEEYQKGILNKFTSRELEDLEAFTNRDTLPFNLVNSIMPALRRDRWEETPDPHSIQRTYSYPCRVGGGNFQRSNDRVWKAMVPSLMIASRFLMSDQILPMVRFLP